MASRTKVAVAVPGFLGILGDPGDLFEGAVLACGAGPVLQVEVKEGSALSIRYGGSTSVVRWAGDLKVRGDAHDAARRVLEYLDWGSEPVEVAYAGGPPWGWGLGNDAPALVGLLRALMAWRGHDVPPHALAEVAFWLEQEALGSTGSLAAAYAAAFGGLCFMEFVGKLASNARVYGTVERLSSLVGEVPLVAAHRGPGRPARDAIVGVSERWRAGEQRVVEAYAIIAQLAREGKKAILHGDWADLGRLMNENAIIQNNFTAMDAHTEHLAEIAVRSGAIGVRPVGAGECGTVVALHLEPQKLERAWRDAGADLVPVLT